MQHKKCYLEVGTIIDPIIVNPEKAMAPHSRTLAWKIPRAEEPGGLQSTRSQRVGHDWATSLSLFIFMRWRRKWQPTPVFLPGESQGRGSLVGCRLWGCTELDTTEVTAAVEVAWWTRLSDIKNFFPGNNTRAAFGYQLLHGALQKEAHLIHR